MAVKFANNVSTSLSAAINATQTTISVADASGLPTLSSGDYVYLTIDTDTNSPTIEVVKVTAISSNSLTVVRGQDGTTASSFSSGTKVELRVTAAALDDISSAADTESVSISGDTMTGDLVISKSTPMITFKGSDAIWYRLRVNEVNDWLELGHSSNKALYLRNTGVAQFNYDIQGDGNLTLTDDSARLRFDSTLDWDFQPQTSDASFNISTSSGASRKFRFQNTGSAGIMVDIHGELQINGTGVITGARALQNITSISSGAIASSGVVTSAGLQFNTNFTNPTTSSASFYDQASVGPTASGYKFQVRTGSNNAMAAAITVDNSQNTQLHGTLTSGAITSSGAVSATGLGINESSRLSPVHVTVTSSQTALTLQNTLGGSGANVGLDFITYNDISGYANPSARISAVDDGAHGGNVTFYGKASGIAGALSAIMTVKAKGDVQVNSGDLDILTGNLTIKGTAGFNATGETASIYLGDSNSEIRATYNGGTRFFLNAVDRMEIEGGTGNLNLKTGNLELNGTTRITNAGNATLGTISSGTITVSGEIYATNSSNNLVIGNSASGNIYLGGGNNNTSNIYLQTGSSTAVSINSSNQSTFHGDVVVQGGLTVQGTTTTIDTANLNVEDNNITLNYSTGDSSATANGAGITIQDAVSSSSDATLTWDATNDHFVFSHYVRSSDTIEGGGGDKQLLAKGTEADIWLTSTGGGSGTWRVMGSTGNSTKLFRIYDHDAGVNRLTVDTSSNVTIGGNITSGAITSSGDIVTTDSSGTNKVTLSRYTGVTFRGNGTGSRSLGTTSNDALNLIQNNQTRVIIDTTGNVVFNRAGNTNRGNIAIGPQTSGTNKWSSISGAHYNQTTGSGNGSGAAGIFLIGSHAMSGSNDVYVGGGPYEMNPATAIRFHTHTATTHTTGGTEVAKFDSAGHLYLQTGDYKIGSTTVINSSRNITINQKIDNSLGNLLDHDGTNNYIKGGNAGSNILYIEASGVYTNNSIIVGNNASKQVITRHIDGKYGNSNSYENLYLNYYSGNAVILGRSDLNTTLQVNGPIQIASSTVIDTSRNFTGGSVTANALVVGAGNSNASIYRSGSAGSGFHFTTNAIYPATETGAVANGTEDLGGASNKFKDGFFSGNFMASVYKVGTTTVLDSSRNLQNIGNLNSQNIGADGAGFTGMGFGYSSNTLTRAVGSGVQWYKVAAFVGGVKAITMRVSAGGDNTNATDTFFISCSSYGMKANIMKFPSTRYNGSKLMEVRTKFVSGANYEIWVKLNSITTSAGSLHISMNDSGVVSSLSAGTEPTYNSSYDATLVVTVADRSDYAVQTTAKIKVNEGGLFNAVRIGHSSLTGSSAYNNNIESTGSYLLLQRNELSPIELWGSAIESRKNHYFGGSSSTAPAYIDSSGNASMASYRVSGTTVIDSSRNFSGASLTLNGSASYVLDVTSGQNYAARISHNRNNNGTTHSDALFLQNTNSTSSANFVQVGFSTNSTDGQHHRAVIRARHDTSMTYGGILELKTRGSGGSSNVGVRIDANGDVDMPNGRLAVNKATASVNPALDVQGVNTTDGTASFRPDSNKGTRVSHVHYGANGDWYIRSASTSGIVYIQDGGGSVSSGRFATSASGTSTSPVLGITSTNSATFIHASNAFAANMTAGQFHGHFFGKAGSTKNAGGLGYYWSASGSNNNFVSIGHWGADHLLRLYGNGDFNIHNGALQLGATTVIDANRTHFAGTKGYYTTATGNTSTTASTGIKQTYSEGWTAVYADYEPYHEWGLYHDNPANAFYVTAGSSTNNLGSFTVVNHSGNNRTAYQKIRFDQSDGSVRAGGGYYVGNNQFVDAARQNIYLDSFNGGNGSGIHFRTGFTSSTLKYNGSITVQDHNGASADGLHISGYDGVGIGTGGNTYSVDLLVNVSGNTQLYGDLLMGSTTVLSQARALQNVTANASIINAGSFALARMPANLASIATSSGGIYFRGTTERIQGETYATAFYAYNQNDGFLFLNRDGNNSAKAVFHIGGYNNAATAGYSSEDTVITISRNDGAKSNTIANGLSASSYRSRIVKTTTETIFADTQGKHRFDGYISVRRNSDNLRLETSTDPSNYYAIIETPYNYSKAFTIRARGAGNEHEIMKWADAAGLEFNGGANSIIKFSGDNLSSIGDITASGDLTLGGDGLTPKLTMMYDDHASGVVWDTAIQIGRTADLDEGNSAPTYTPTGGYGLAVKANSDGAFFGIEHYQSSNYRPVINWGDDTTDTPFRVAFNNGTRFQFTYDGNFIANGNVTAYSDVRLKENIETIPDALEKVRQIRGVTFTRNDQKDTEKRHMGVIAQELEAAGVSEVVEYDAENDVKTVAYGNMVGLLIEAIKEQSAQIESLNKRIEELENGNH